MFWERGLKQIDLAPIAVTQMVLTQIVLNPIAFAVSRGRHWRTFGCILMLAQILPHDQPIAPAAPDD